MKDVRSNAVERGVVGLCRIVLWLSMVAIFLILVGNTILRYVRGSSLQWANEVPELLFPWLVMSGVVLAAVHSAHIATTFLMEAVPFAIRRFVTLLSWLIVAALYGTLAWATARMLEIVHDEKSAILQMPGSLTYGCVMVGMALLAVLALQSAWHTWHAPEPTYELDPKVPTAHW
jgi:TRAP-type transport system small permease protein